MQQELMVCRGKVAVITGAGRGIGRAHALAFAAAGARVVVNDLGVTYAGEKEVASPADGVVGEILQAGGEAVADYSDVATWEGAETLLATALRAFGRVDVLVNNAAIIRPSALVATSEHDYDDVVRVNVKGTFCPSRAFAAHWVRQSQHGEDSNASIICTTSRIGLHGTPYYLLYGCTKAAVAYFVQAAAAELKPHGIRVNGVAPRADTRMMADATQRLIEIAGDAGLHAVFDSVQSAPPSAHDRQEPASISPLVIWLASELSQPVTGKIFSVAGGRIALQDGWRERGHVALEPFHTVIDVQRTVPSLLST